MRIVELLLIAVSTFLGLGAALKCFQCPNFVCINGMTPEKPEVCSFPEQQHCIAFLGTNSEGEKQEIRGCGTLSPLGQHYQCNVTVVGLKQVGCWYACEEDGCNHVGWPEIDSPKKEKLNFRNDDDDDKKKANDTEKEKEKDKDKEKEKEKEKEVDDSKGQTPVNSSSNKVKPNTKLIIAAKIFVMLVALLY